MDMFSNYDSLSRDCSYYYLPSDNDTDWVSSLKLTRFIMILSYSISCVFYDEFFNINSLTLMMN